MAAFAGYYPSVQADAECGAVRSGFLLGRCGLSRRYGIVAHHCTPAFPVPDPISEAEREQYPTLQDYIREVIIPDMQVKLRQGFGRAIRTETDTCVVSILDHRAAPEERYHRAVLETLPPLHIARKIEDVEDFIRTKKSPDYFMP